MNAAQMRELKQAAALLQADARIVWPKQRAEDGGVLIVRVDAIGDYMLFRPALQALRTVPSFAQERLVLCGNAVWQELAEALDRKSFDAFIPVSRDAFRRDIRYRHGLLQELHAQHFHCAVQPTFSRDYIGDSCIMAAAASRAVGFDCPSQNIQPRLLAFFNRCYTELVTPSNSLPFETERNWEFLTYLGASCADKPAYQEAFPERLCIGLAASLRQFLGSPMLFMGASAPSKRWPAACFAQVARRVASMFDKKVLLTGGADAANAIAVVEETCGEAVVPLPETSLVELAALLAHAPLVVSNDSVGAHMGATWNVPTVIVANGQHRGRFHPYPAEVAPRVRTVYPPACAISSRNLYYADAPYPIEDVPVAAVFEAMEAVLAID
ncbi:MAG: glycosyltransferase family 9 protein [Desulfovibrio sp.]|nr:glycosyltransferase family 9 protein [Desulfovibrio sp.]